MASIAKGIFGVAVGVTRRAVGIGIEVVQRLLRDERDAEVVTPAAAPSPAPEAVGAPRPGTSGGHKSSTTKRTTSRGAASKAAAAGKRARPSAAPSGGSASRASPGKRPPAAQGTAGTRAT